MTGAILWYLRQRAGMVRGLFWLGVQTPQIGIRYCQVRDGLIHDVLRYYDVTSEDARRLVAQYLTGTAES